MNIQRTIEYLNPDLKFFVDYIVEDNSDGNGPVFRALRDDVTLPSVEEVQNAWDETVSILLKKEEEIAKYKEIEKEAVKARSEYLTAELLPESEIKAAKLAKLELSRTDIESRFNAALTDLVAKYGSGIISEII